MLAQYSRALESELALLTEWDIDAACAILSWRQWWRQRWRQLLLWSWRRLCWWLCRLLQVRDLLSRKYNVAKERE